jgi:hypothetical protein
MGLCVRISQVAQVPQRVRRAVMLYVSCVCVYAYVCVMCMCQVYVSCVCVYTYVCEHTGVYGQHRCMHTHMKMDGDVLIKLKMHAFLCLRCVDQAQDACRCVDTCLIQDALMHARDSADYLSSLSIHACNSTP